MTQSNSTPENPKLSSDEKMLRLRPSVEAFIRDYFEKAGSRGWEDMFLYLEREATYYPDGTHYDRLTAKVEDAERNVRARFDRWDEDGQSRLIFSSMGFAPMEVPRTVACDIAEFYEAVADKSGVDPYTLGFDTVK